MSHQIQEKTGAYLKQHKQNLQAPDLAANESERENESSQGVSFAATGFPCVDE